MKARYPLVFFAALFLPATAIASGGPGDTGTTASMPVSTALVLLMIPGLAMFAKRVRFRGYVLFIALWFLFVYVPLCHRVWASDGWL